MFKYKVVGLNFDYSSDKAKQLEATLNEHGAEGWELCSTTKLGDGNETLIFKKPLLEDEQNDK
ncbi:hypothetical protein D3C81_763320 [compost metagenome]